jgi:hypothetical protein
MQHWEHDAEEFGDHVKHGGWRLGLLVARNVEKAGHGGDRRSSFNRKLNEKVNATEFAKRAGTSAPRVLRYLEAWSVAADAGIVPHADNLKPDTEVDLPDDETSPWSDFYDGSASQTNRTPSDLRDAVAREAEAAGISEGAVARARRDKNAIAAAIKADPKLRDVAEAAVAEARFKEIMPERREPRTEPTPLAEIPAVVDMIAALSGSHNSLQTALRIWTDDGPFDESRTVIADMCHRLAAQANGMADLVLGLSDDDLAILSEEVE